MSNMVNDVIEGSLWCLPMDLPPHKLVQMGRESCPLHTAHVLKSSFCVFPIIFYLVCAGTSDGIHEIVLMNNNEVLVPRNYWNIYNIIVAAETIAMNYGSRSNVFPNASKHHAIAILHYTWLSVKETCVLWREYTYCKLTKCN